MAENIAIARPYAEAVFQLANEAGQLAGWSEALHAAAIAVDDEDLVRLISSPKVDAEQIAGIVADVARQATESALDADRFDNLLKLLAENGRLLTLADIATLFDKLKADVENIIDVILTAAAPVDDAQQVKISEALKRRFGREIKLHFKLDENLIGGARLQAGDLLIDGSIRTELDQLASSLTN